MDTEVVELVSGLEVCVREGEGAWLEAGLADAALAVGPPPVGPPPPPGCPTIRGLSSACWITFTPSGLVQTDSLVLAL